MRTTSVTGTGHAATSRDSSATSSRPFSQTWRPELYRRYTGVLPTSAAKRVPKSAPGVASRNQPRSVSTRPCRKTTTLPVASGKAAASVRRSTSTALRAARTVMASRPGAGRLAPNTPWATPVT